MNYQRDVATLQSLAVLWWPESLTAGNKEVSIIPKLLETQEKFLSILTLCDAHPEQIFNVLQASKFPINLFLKHLCVLADYGGEPIQRLGSQFHSVFPENKMEYTWKGQAYEYNFGGLPVRALTSKRLFLDGIGLNIEVKVLEPLYKDMIMILLHGGSSTSSNHAGLEKCEIGILLGDKTGLEKFVKERYIFVSRITGGATSNTLGQLLQKNVVKILTESLGAQYDIQSNGSISVIGYELHGMPFDIVVSKIGSAKKIGIEVSFQVTTNSTIERKAGLAKERMRLMHESGHNIAYIIDGAGNFQRTSALSTICSHSDCTVVYNDDDINNLACWIADFYD